jgi:hypothetical protein
MGETGVPIGGETGFLIGGPIGLTGMPVGLALTGESVLEFKEEAGIKCDKPWFSKKGMKQTLPLYFPFSVVISAETTLPFCR